MPFTEEELTIMFPDDSTQTVVDEECPEGFEKDEITGECVPAQITISEDFDPQEGLQEWVSMTDTLKKGPDAIESIEIEEIDKPLVPDLNYAAATDWGLDFIEDTFNRQYENGTLTEEIGYVDNLWGIKGKLVPKSIQEFLDYEVITDAGNKEIEKVAKAKGVAAFNSLMQNNPTIRKTIIPDAYKKIEHLLEGEQLRLQKKYTAKDAAKAIIEFDEFRDAKINEAIQNNPIFKQILEANAGITQSIIEDDIQRLGKGALGLEDFEESAEFLEAVKSGKMSAETYRKNKRKKLSHNLSTGVRRMSRYLKEYQLMTRGSSNVGLYKETRQQMSKSEAMALKENWTDDTVVYVKKGETQGGVNTGNIIPEVLDGRKQRIPGEQGAYEKTTWKEAKEFQKTLLAPLEEKALENFDEAQAIKDAVTYFDKADFTDGFTLSDLQIGFGEFLPQIPLGILTAGMGIVMQEIAGNYTDGLYAIAKTEYGTDQPTPEQLFKLINEEKDQKALAVATGIPQGAMELFGIGKMAKLAKAVIKAAKPAALVRGVRGQIGQVLKNLAGKPVRKAAITSGFYEMLTETGQTLGSQTSQTIASGGRSYYNFDEILNAAGMGFSLGLFIPFAGGAVKQTTVEFKNTASILAGKFNPNHVENVFKRMETDLQRQQDEGLITPEQKREKLLILGQVRTAQASLPKFRIPKGKGEKPGSDSNKKQVVGEDSSITGDFGQNLTEEQRIEAINLLMERQRIENYIKETDKTLVDPKLKEIIKEINLELAGLAISQGINKIKLKGKDMTVAEDVSLTKSFAQLLGIDVDEDIANDPVAFQKFIDDNNIDFNIKVDSGFTFTDAKGNEKVYLNMPVILKNGVNFKSASHELMHALLDAEVQKDPAKFRRKINEFIDNNLSEQQKDDLNLLMLPYDNKYLESRPDEFITQMWEGGLFKKDDSLLQKFKDLVSSIFNTIIPGVKIDTENSSELESFFSAYSESYKTGKLSQEIIDRKKSSDKLKKSRRAKEKADGAKNRKGIVPLSKELTQSSKETAAQNKIIEDKIAEDNVRDSEGNLIANENAREELLINNLGKVRALAQKAYDAGKGLEINKRVTFDQFFSGYYEELYKMTGTYKQNLNPKGFGAYMMTNLEKRYTTIKDEAKGKIQTKSIDEGTLQIASQESTSPKPEIDKRSIYPDAVLPKTNEFSDKFLTNTKFNLKTLSTEELSNLTYKTSKIIAPQAFADIWSLPLKVITQSNFNLSDIKNIRRLQSWIRDNADNLIKLLPEGNTSVKESDSKRKNADGTFKKIKRGGESLALPDNIRDNPIFYTQLFKADGTPLKIDSETLNAKGKSKSKSNQYRKRPDITRSQFLNVFGVTNNKSDKQFDVRESEAQSIKGLLEIVGRNITNYYAEQELDTRQDISPSKKAFSKSNIRDGASKIAFSKEFNIKFTYEVHAEIKLFNPLLILKPYYDFASPHDYKKYVYGSAAADNYAADWQTMGVEFFPLVMMKASAFTSGNEKHRLANKMPFYSDSNKNSPGNFWKFKKDFAKEIAKRKKEGLPVATFTEEELGDIKFAMQSKDNFFDTSKSGWKLKKDQNYRGGLLIIKMFEKLNKEYPQAINMTTAWFQSAVNSTSHPWRQFAFPRLLDENYLRFELLKLLARKDLDNGIITQEKYEELTNKKDGVYGTVKEHMWQQNDAADFLLPSIINQTVDDTWPFIELNYYQGGIIRRNDNKLKDTEEFYGPAYNHGNVMVKPFKDGLVKAIKSGDINDAIESIIRYLMPEVSKNDGGFDLNTTTFDNKSLAKIYNLQIPSNKINKESIANQQTFARNIVEKTLTQERAREILLREIRLASTIAKTSVVNNNKLKEAPITPLSKEIVFTNKNVLDRMEMLDKAFDNARNSQAPLKGISIWDFDDTLAVTKSNVLYELPSGKKGKLSATEFAKRSGELESQGAIFDFKEFNEITKGKKGPMFQKAVDRNKKFGNDNVFILTARPNTAAKPIHDFLKALGLNIPLKNIIGLENGLPSAKADWIVNKAAEGYNDFYFADDAYKNVKAVQDALDVLDVKSKSRQATAAFSKELDLDKDFNEIIERATGIGKEKQYGKSKASIVGEDKGKWDWAGIPPSAQDFVGLTRYFAGKGKEGDATIAWVKKNFIDPFARANIDISNARVALANDFKALKKLLNINSKDLNKKITGEPYTVGNAIRVYTWTQQGMKIPGLSQADAKTLNNFVINDPNLVVFSQQLIAINKDNGYPVPGKGWMGGTITTDLLTSLNTVVRAKYLAQWQNNVNEVFTEANLNKLEAAFGKGYRDALENMLGRMKTGSNRGFKGDTLTGRFIDWINGSVGAIMFLNMRSAVLQTISAVNFVNWTDNSPIKAAKAFANQSRFWNDVVDLMNSDYLVERRNGLKINVNEADIAEIAAESKNKAKAFIAKLLKLGFLPTQIADSFAIATGGATFYRNRIKTYLKEGLSQKEAEAQAFQDFREIAEENQQSSRPDRISAQQAGPLGRIILAFANTPAQYARIMQKAMSNIKNGRGDFKTNMSKIVYYGAIQNVIFNALQQALFAMAFGDEEPEEEKKNEKYISIVNGMLDSLLRGIGFHGAAIASIKNAILKMAQGGKAQDAVEEILKFSPPISSKYKKMRGAGRTLDWDKKEMREKGLSLDNPAYLALGQVISAATNIPLDRVVRKLTNIKDASDSNNEEWQRVANVLGWEKWELEWEKSKKKGNSKSKKRKVKKKKIKKRL